MGHFAPRQAKGLAPIMKTHIRYFMRNHVAWCIVHEQQNLAVFTCHTAIEHFKKLLKNSIHHPGFLIGVVVTVQYGINLLEAAWIQSFANDKW